MTFDPRVALISSDGESLAQLAAIADLLAPIGIVCESFLVDNITNELVSRIANSTIQVIIVGLGSESNLPRQIADQVTQPVVAILTTSGICQPAYFEALQSGRPHAPVAVVSSQDFVSAAKFAARIVALDDPLVHSSLEELL